MTLGTSHHIRWRNILLHPHDSVFSAFVSKRPRPCGIVSRSFFNRLDLDLAKRHQDFIELSYRFSQLVNPCMHLQRSLQQTLPSLRFWYLDFVGWNGWPRASGRGQMFLGVSLSLSKTCLSPPRPNFQTFWEPLGKTILKESRKV